MKINYILLVTISFLFSACNDTNNNSSAATLKPANELSISDFTLDNVTGLSQSEFLTELNGQDNFFFTSPTNSPSFSSQCVDDKIASSSNNYNFEAENDGSYSLYIPKVDVSKCFPEISNAEVLTSIFIQHLIILNDGGAQVSLDNLHFADVNFTDPHVKQENMYLSVSYSGELYGKAFHSKMYRITYGSEDFNSTCIMKNPFQCTVKTLQTISSTQDDSINLNKIITLHTNTTYTDINDTYFTSGYIDFEINNWSGTMNYTGPNEAPTFSAQSLNDFASGTFTYSEQ